MKRRTLSDVVYRIVYILVIFPVLLPAVPPTDSRPANLVVIILNSIRYSDTFGDKRHLYIENIWEKIRPHGTLCKNVRNNSLTLPLPAQAILLSGVLPGKTDTFPAVRPTLFEYYRKQSGAVQNKVLFIAGDSGSAALACSNTDGYGQPYAPNVLVNDTGDMEVNAFCRNTAAYFKKHHPSMAVISLTTGKAVSHDSTGAACELHSDGADDACGTGELLNKYYEDIIVNDMIIGEVWKILETDEFYRGTTVFLIVSSQGRHTDDYSSYGDNCEGCSKLLFLIAGPGVKKNHVSGKKRYLTDVVPTIGRLMGIKTEYATGTPMREVLSAK
jgi:hypothetical protein